ncbi:hypothetical protein [Orrella sp. 11846]|uniref:hypothetical protein n=1 Tax=Orrella sp. 11846 TaxID=3409913 RepID=UPI003B5AA400
MKKVTVHLPWPNSKLLPNRRGGRHWGSYQNQKVDSRAQGFIAAAESNMKHLFSADDLVKVMIVFYAPDARLRDLDGLYSSLKHAQDGICRYFGIDDSRMNPVTLVRRIDPDKVGYVVMTLEKLEEEP